MFVRVDVAQVGCAILSAQDAPRTVMVWCTSPFSASGYLLFLRHHSLREHTHSCVCVYMTVVACVIQSPLNS
jgi:hypothetical protein